ncbi:MAG: VTT domain-containing protein [Micavibrio aeruginosavorus]|uniref:VTT domain-containing protein n=1 Tax=Micavibrio aeruginosavorus TaxID=349221 RepID=A0A7T5UI18_9BACT|nr:MAG: VTT domain-containing protein [Micavibrio aeruginosavorus]
MHFDIIPLIKSLGYFGIWGAVFAESGIVFCFFFPGDSLLFTAGVIAAQGFLNLGILAAGCFIAAVTGNMLGYEVGKRTGLRLFKNGDTRFLKRKHLEMTQRFFDRHGKMAIILARFLPIIRTFTPFLAGMAQVPYRLFILYSIIGALAWAVGLALLGYFLGEMIPAEQLDRYLLPIVLGIIVLSIMPSAWHLYKEMKMVKKGAE